MDVQRTSGAWVGAIKYQSVSCDGAELKGPDPTKLQEEIGLAKNKGPLSSVIPFSGHSAGHGCGQKTKQVKESSSLRAKLLRAGSA